MKRRILFYRNIAIVCFLMILALSGCDKECPPEDGDKEFVLNLDFDVNKEFHTSNGGVGRINGEFKEFDNAQMSLSENGLYTINIIDLEWYDNQIWAARQIVNLNNLDLTNLNAGDTIYFNKSEFDNQEEP